MIKKRIIGSLLLLSAVVVLQAQNVQLHYDFGRHIFSDEEPNRQKVTLTLEHFKADKWGSWFYFVDVDMSRKFTESAYLEISREFKFGKQSPFSAHVEYNGGLNRHGSFQQAALVGAAWNGHVADFSKTWSVQLLYKQYFKSYENSRSYASVQLTGVWKLVFAHKALTFSGFVDLWRGENAAGHGQLVFLTEPQLWYNLNTLWGEDGINLSVGTEWEMSNNFIFNTTNGKTFFFNPTLAVKWTF